MFIRHTSTAGRENEIHGDFCLFFCPDAVICVFFVNSISSHLRRQGIVYQHKKLSLIDQFRYIKIQPKTIDLSTRLLGINPTNSVFIPMSLVLRSIALG